MRYLAASETERRPILRRSHRRLKAWHAVADVHPRPEAALCGYRYTAEPHRVWDQTPVHHRCPLCERLVADATVGSSPDRPRHPHTPRQWPSE